MPELPWEKWYPTNWASEPGLRLCEAATRGIWFEMINTMMLSQTDHVSGTEEQLAAMCACRVPQIQLAVSQLKQFKVANITEQDGNITLTSRRRLRDGKIKDLRRKAGIASATKRQQPPQQGVPTPSASASVYASSNGRGFGGNQPTEDMARKWLADWNRSGATYTWAETRSAFLSLEANGWMWGKNPVVDHRAALERQIQTDRQRKTKPAIQPQSTSGNF